MATVARLPLKQEPLLKFVYNPLVFTSLANYSYEVDLIPAGSAIVILSVYCSVYGCETVSLVLKLQGIFFDF